MTRATYARQLLMVALVGLVCLVCSSARRVDAQATSTRRFALVVGANNGGESRVTLRYAATDARSIARVMQQLGGLSDADHRVVLDPTRDELLGTLDQFAPAIAQAHSAGQRVEFLFYYSGHSDEQGILLRHERIGYAEVRARLGALPSDVRIAVLDSCASGSLTRLKGGQHQAPFLLDSSSDVRGHAFLTSSSADEAAQESDRIGASFFTHYLVSGLRGAADFNGDRRVTLNEAYRFAFDETLRRTETTQGGAQHPSYDIQLAGSGDLVMTDLRQTSSTLSIERSLQARLYLRDASGALVAELFKPAGRTVDLALPPGRYEILADHDGALSRASVELRDGSITVLNAGSLTPVVSEATASRGDDAPAAPTDGAAQVPVEPASVAADAPVAADTPVAAKAESDEEVITSDGYRVLPFAVSFFTPLDTNAIEKRRKVVNYFALNLVYGQTHRVEGAQLGFGVNRALEDVEGVQSTILANWIDRDLMGAQFSVGLNHIGGDGRGVQMTSGVNNVAGHFLGAQFSSGLNIANTIDGAQLGLLNVVTGQFAGAQVGLVNVAAGRARGVQLGLVNYADEADASIALIGVTRKGGVHPMLWSSNTAAVNVGVRFDANYTYTFLGAGMHPAGAGESLLFGLGLGLKLPFTERIGIEFDLSQWFVAYAGDFNRSGQLAMARLQLHLQVADRLAITFGPTFNVALNHTQRAEGLRPGFGPAYRYRHDADPYVDLAIYPGFSAGVVF